MEKNCDNIDDTAKKKTMSFISKNSKENQFKIFSFLSNISKNIYNITLYISSIFYRYKEIIYKDAKEFVDNNNITEVTQFNAYIQSRLDFFYKLHSNKDSVIHSNNKILYSSIIKHLGNNIITNDNFSTIRKLVIDENKNIKHSCKYEFEFIVDEILKTMYLKNYNKTLYEIKGKIPITIKDEKFKKDILAKKNLFPNVPSFKTLISTFKKIHSDQNVLTRFIYNNLGVNKDMIPSDMIINIIKKTFDNISSYFVKKQKGLHVNKSKYLLKEELFIIPFFERSFKIINNTIRLTVGKYVAKNYNEITGKKLICLNKNEITDYKLYVDKKHLLPNVKKVAKSKNYICDDGYINKCDKNIINSYYITINLPQRIKDKKIKLIEVNPLYNGVFFKINIVYDEPANKASNNDILKNNIVQDNKSVNKASNDVILENNIDPDKSISIDLGINNLMTIYDPLGNQKILKGGTIISINNYYNRLIDKARSEKGKNPTNKKIKEKYYLLELKRKNKINDYFNKVIKKLEIDYKEKNHIIIGYNYGWKTSVNLNKKTNRKFYNIPYSKLLIKLKDKFGERLIVTEESYTSKCDSLGLEEIKKKEVYDGERKYRGLYSSKINKLINADLNGAINIMRKVVNLIKIKGKGLFNPEKIKIRS